MARFAISFVTAITTPKRIIASADQARRDGKARC